MRQSIANMSNNNSCSLRELMTTGVLCGQKNSMCSNITQWNSTVPLFICFVLKEKMETGRDGFKLKMDCPYSLFVKTFAK